METILLEIIKRLKEANSTPVVDGANELDADALEHIIRKHNRNLIDNAQHHSKKKLMPYYLKVKESDPERWAGWGIDQTLEKQLLQLLQIKPGRTASGVATITVLTKPWTCSSNCLYCPNDLTMPKSYMSDEPACQRAERNYFDPYLQVASRLRALTQMGHVTDKVELIVLGGTWSDYPKEYQVWFVTELFRALNEVGDTEHACTERRAFYKGAGLSNRKEELQDFVSDYQERVNQGDLTYNQAWNHLYRDNDVWGRIAAKQVATFDELKAQHTLNEHSSHRVVGLVVETRPDTIDCDSLKLLRQLGCTKVQIGIQSLDPAILKLNNRTITIEKIQEAFSLLRIFGFKIHAHFMVNLYGSSRNNDKHDYRRFVTEIAYLPDEVKLYPCVLIRGTKLCEYYAEKTWQPYSEDALIDVLVADTLITPPYTRISRMIRDFSAHDVVAGNKKVNLRQSVERAIDDAGHAVSEIRYREIQTRDADVQNLALETIRYETAVTNEYFLQWVTPENNIAGFLRLSLPHADYVRQLGSSAPVAPDEAMIREVHVYGKVAGLHKTGKGAQHLGLGKQLIKEACAIAKDHGYAKMNVISSVGTREYYRSLGFVDNDLYQQIDLSV